MCGEPVYATTDVCVLDANSEMLLLVQEVKTQLILRIPSPQLIAEAIATFQSNNTKRVDDLFLNPLQSVVLSGISLAGTFSRFYKMRVTADCVWHGDCRVPPHTPRTKTSQRWD
ncbi:hypothetical protein HD554DRAFT_2126322, partial [Boletus coccyginus]